MNPLYSLFSFGWTERLAMILAQSLWEDALIALLLAGVMLITRRAAIRHAAGCCALALMIVSPIFTIGNLPSTPAPPPMDETIVKMPDAAIAPIVTPISPNTPVSVSHPWFVWVVAAWLAGVAGLSLRNLIGWIHIRRLARQGAQPPPAWRETLRELTHSIGAPGRIRLLVSQRLHVPAVIGFVNPIIFFPASAVSGLSPEVFRAILLHELAHIRRWDYLLNLLQIMVETCLFYHPAVWWVSGVVRQERENCCDDLAAAGCESRLSYARALAAIAGLPGGRRWLALGAKDGKLLARIQRLVGPDTRRRSPIMAMLLVAAAFFLLFSVAPRSKAQAQAAPAATQPDNVIGILPGDLVPDQSGPRVGAGDRISVSIFDLMGEGTGESVRHIQVNNDGSINLPFIKPFKIDLQSDGPTTNELEKLIASAYADAGMIRNARVSVQIDQGGIYYIGGDVPHTGGYAVGPGNVRLLEALIIAGGGQNVQTVQVIRSEPDPQNSGKMISRKMIIPGDKLWSGDANMNVFVHRHDVIVVKGNPEAAEPARAVLVTVGNNILRLDGKDMTWDGLATALQNLPDHVDTVVKLGVASPDMKVGDFFQAKVRVSDLVEKYGFKYLSNVGIDDGNGEPLRLYMQVK